MLGLFSFVLNCIKKQRFCINILRIEAVIEELQNRYDCMLGLVCTTKDKQGIITETVSSKLVLSSTKCIEMIG